ncbi:MULTISPECIES: helix-turn-helix domain-containing protein [unclassified Brucella]|uniref:helix-turn-helix domain-containing protein n=1 Tax=Brucella amazoniensis TaxID=2837955 RepID=UPI00384CC83B
MGAPQDRIHADRIQSAIATGGAARSALVASWRRSAELHGLDPTEPGSVRTLSENEFRIAFERMDRLVNIALSCTVAPIHDHRGHLMAALDVSSCRADLTEAFAQLISVAVIDAARRIEAENFRQAFPDARIMLAPTPDRTGGALIAVDKDDLVIGATRAARLALELDDEALAGALPAADLLGMPADPREDMAESERGVILRALARAEGNISAAAQLLGISRATLHRKLNRLKIIRSH